MLNQHISSNIGETTIDTELTAVEKVIAFLDEHLPDFPAVFKKKTVTEKITAENKISQELSFFLNLNHQNKIFLFHFQYYYPDSTRSSDFAFIDVETYSSSPESTKSFFVIEAKCLPTDRKNREKEYVSSNAGGIQRYKKGNHGKGLTNSALIGYVQAENGNYWHKEINKWINDLILTNTEIDISWDSNDLLAPEKDLITTQKYSSKSTRIVDSVKDSIKLHHYLMNLV